MDLLTELRAYLDTLTITSDNIGEIRRSLFVPWDSAWNGIVRDETAQREENVSNAKPDFSAPTLRHDQGLAIAKALRGEISHGKLAEILDIRDVHGFKLASGAFDERSL